MSNRDSASSSASTATTSSPETKFMVSLQRSLGGKAYPEQPKNTPVDAVRIFIALLQLGHFISVKVGVFARIPSSASAILNLRVKAL